jgi:hypothetical protein
MQGLQMVASMVGVSVGRYRRIKLSSLSGASDNSGIPNFRQLFRIHIEEDWAHKVRGLVLGYDQNVLLLSIFI